jgi:hypothetical protein
MFDQETRRDSALPDDESPIFRRARRRGKPRRRRRLAQVINWLRDLSLLLSVTPPRQSAERRRKARQA